ncbi:hypothetical protein [Micromonospora sp. MH33]|nr:hypothetical protein [Micromonospora sp. MH33]
MANSAVRAGVALSVLVNGGAAAHAIGARFERGALVERPEARAA